VQTCPNSIVSLTRARTRTDLWLYNTVLNNVLTKHLVFFRDDPKPKLPVTMNCNNIVVFITVTYGEQYYFYTFKFEDISCWEHLLICSHLYRSIYVRFVRLHIKDSCTRMSTRPGYTDNSTISLEDTSLGLSIWSPIQL